MHPDVVKLLDLQARDMTLRDVDARLEAVRGDEVALDDAVRQAEQAVDAARRAAQAGAARRDELETRIESYRALQERRRQRLEFVRNPKEGSALMAELELARSVLAKEENEWVRVSDAAAELAGQVGDAERMVVETQAAQASARSDIAAQRSALEAERADALELREASAMTMDKTLRLRYERLRRSRAPTVVAPLNGAACGYCYTAVPLSRRSQIRAGLLLDGCEACGVILYSAEAAG